MTWFRYHFLLSSKTLSYQHLAYSVIIIIASRQLIPFLALSSLIFHLEQKAQCQFTFKALGLQTHITLSSLLLKVACIYVVLLCMFDYFLFYLETCKYRGKGIFLQNLYRLQVQSEGNLIVFVHFLINHHLCFQGKKKNYQHISGRFSSFCQQKSEHLGAGTALGHTQLQVTSISLVKQMNSAYSTACIQEHLLCFAAAVTW